MKTPEFYLDEVAKEKLHTESFSRAIEMLWRNEDIDWGLKNINEVVKEAMLRHSKEACEEQRKICAESAAIEGYSTNDNWVDIESILNAKSPLQ